MDSSCVGSKVMSKQKDWNYLFPAVLNFMNDIVERNSEIRLRTVNIHKIINNFEFYKDL